MLPSFTQSMAGCPAGGGAALHAVLNDEAFLAATFSAAFDELAAFPDVVADGLLDVDVLACGDGGHGDQRVGVVRRGDGDGIDLRIGTAFR